MTDKNRGERFGEGYSLEDILAEFKGNAYIAGEKKLPVSEMQKRAEEIMLEARREEKHTAEESKPDKPPRNIEFKLREAPENEPFVNPFEDEPADNGVRSVTGRYFEEAYSETEKQKDPVLTVTEPEHTTSAFSEAKIGREELSGDEEETEQGIRAGGKIIRGIFGHKKREKTEADDEEDLNFGEGESFEEEPEPSEEEIPENEPRLKDVYRAYAVKARSLRLRSMCAAVICIVMAYLVFASEYGLPLPQELIEKGILLPVIFLVAELIVILLGADIFLSGLRDFIRLKAGAESLVAFSLLASLLDALYITFSKSFDMGGPFCAVAACSMLFAMIGAYKTARAYMITFRTASALSTPYRVTAESDRVEGGTVLMKVRGGAEGFVTKSHKHSLTEKVLLFAAPVLILGSLGLSILASVGGGEAYIFFRCLAAMAAVSAPFSMLLVFGHPFRALAARLAGSGAALAGWQGACDMGNALGMVIGDGDLFPTGTLSITGINILANISKEKVLSYTGSIIISSGSGLADTFSELLRTQRCNTETVGDFSCYEGGGLSAIIRGDRVLVGSSGFMNLMGIRIQENMNIKNAIYCAINDELSGVFIVNYNPISSVQGALMALLTRKLLSLFAVRDFNITTMMLKQKFKIPAERTERIEILSFAERYRLSEPPRTKKQPAAVIVREGLGPYAHAVIGGRGLQIAVCIGTVIMMIGAFVGLALMFYMCNKGAFTAASAANTLTFMLAWLIPVFFLSGPANRY